MPKVRQGARSMKILNTENSCSSYSLPEIVHADVVHVASDNAFRCSLLYRLGLESCMQGDSLWCNDWIRFRRTTVQSIRQSR